MENWFLAEMGHHFIIMWYLRWIGVTLKFCKVKWSCFLFKFHIELEHVNRHQQLESFNSVHSLLRATRAYTGGVAETLSIGYFGSRSTLFAKQSIQHSFPTPVVNATFKSTLPTIPQSEVVSSSQLVPSFDLAFTQQSNRRPDPYPGSPEVTLLHLCDPRVTTCAGCSKPIRSAGMVIPQHGDVVPLTKMRRDYIANGEKSQGKLGNVYFHSNTNCIRSKCPHSFPSLLCVTANVRSLVMPIHRQHLLTSLHRASKLCSTSHLC